MCNYIFLSKQKKKQKNVLTNIFKYTIPFEEPALHIRLFTIRSFVNG